MAEELAYRPARGACYRPRRDDFLVLLQRWEKGNSYRFRRHFHSKNATVLCLPREIDEWGRVVVCFLNGPPMEKTGLLARGMFKAQHIGILTSLP